MPHTLPPDELGQSPDLLAQQQAALLHFVRQTVPELMSDNQLDLHKLKAWLDEADAAAPNEHYELTWAGKTAARREVQKTTSHTLRPDPTNPAQAGHMLIEGENLEVLRVLQRSYYGKVPAYKGLMPHAVSEVHNGYFSGDKKGKGAKAKTVWVDTTEKGSAKDDSTYELIMRDKERLLSMSEPLQFIFSHSALREGWDNPNVFQICTLNESHSAMKKRQEIGRGLRLCVNQNGERVVDKKVNTLTVIPNESFEAFAKSLQKEIEDETGVKFEGRVNNARAKARVACKPLTQEEDALFQAIWNKINYQTRYSVKLETPELIARCVALLRDKTQYPTIRRPKVKSEKGLLHIDQHGVHGVRFVERDEKQWQCPHCQHTMSAPEPGEELEWIRNERFGLLRQFGFHVGTQLTPIDDVHTNALYWVTGAVHDLQTPPSQAIVCFDSHLETETLEWLRQQKVQRVIVLEAALDTTAKWNLHHQLGDGLVVF